MSNRYARVSAVKLSDSVIDEVRKSSLPPGFPILIDLSTMVLCEAHNLFLRNTRINYNYTVGYSAAVNSEANDLRDFLEFLDYRDPNLAWSDVLPEDVIAYRDALLTTISPTTLRPYSVKTVRRSLSTILSFYRYATKENWYRNDVDEMNKLKLAHTSYTGHLDEKATFRRLAKSDVLPKDKSSPEDTARPIPPDELRRVLSLLGPLPPLPGQPQTEARKTRNRLIAEVSLHTGMRRDEIRHLTLSQFVTMNDECNRRNLELNQGVYLYLVKTKGLKRRRVLVPVWLIRSLEWYVKFERSIVKKETSSDADYVFLNHKDSSRNPSAQITNDTISNMFHTAIVSAEMVHQERLRDPLSNEIHSITTNIHSFHDLRHTFAVMLYVILSKEGKQKPWKLVQTLLGHQSVETTLSIYLKLVDTYEPMITDAIANYFRQMREVAHE